MAHDLKSMETSSNSSLPLIDDTKTPMDHNPSSGSRFTCSETKNGRLYAMGGRRAYAT